MQNATRTLFLASALTVLALAYGCGGSPKTEPPAPEAKPAAGPQAARWDFAPKALELTLVSDPFLNEHGGAAHPLTVCVYQLAEPDAFRREAATPQGMARLLACSKFDDGVVSAKSVIVKPGQDETLVLDRDPKARFLAVACGYYDANPATATRIFEIPVASETSGWLWWKQTQYRPARLSRKILLGKAGMAGDGN